MSKQLEFSLWDRGQKFHALRVAVFRLEDGTPLTRIQSKNVRSLVEQIELCSGSSGCHARVEVLAKRMECGESTFREILSLAEKRLQVVIVNRRPKQAGGQGPSSYEVDWNRIASHYRPARPAETPAQVAVQVGAQADFCDQRPPSRNRGAPSRNRGAPSRNRRAMIIDPSLDPNGLDPISCAGTETTVSPENENENGICEIAGAEQPASDKHNTAKNKTGGWSRELTEDLLRRAETVDELFDWAVDRFGLRDTEQQRLQFHTLAVHCVRRNAAGVLRSIGATFTKLVRERKWQGSNEDEERARRGIKELDRLYEAASVLSR